ncbi:MAG: NAD(P) transhydrogenase subunit alpha [Gemmatimonadetes bacterium]|nr:NAD(P) transhydrogenase subunit alpha [Gemmatimonadota bacterium]
MHISVPKETTPRETRVGLVPESVAKLVKGGHTVAVERDAGLASGFTDDQYVKAGATIAPDFAATVAGAAATCKVQPVTAAQASALPSGSALVSYWAPTGQPDALAALNARQVRLLALERVPRITRAQSMDVLSSQATVSGYKAVLLGAGALPKLLPMLSTAAGTLAPAKVFVIGAGVAGLQAIATARRLGALVSGFDVRPAAAEQILSLGATLMKLDLAAVSAVGDGGYAKAQTAKQQLDTQGAITAHVKDMDLVITTAAIPGKKAPVLITDAAIRGMKQGSVIVDLAAETGGNAEGTKAGETVVVHGVSIIGPVNLPSTAGFHASQMYSRNVLTFLNHVIKDGNLVLEESDEITGPMMVKA